MLDKKIQTTKIVYSYGGPSPFTILFGLLLLAIGLAGTAKAHNDDSIENYVEFLTLAITFFGGLIASIKRGIIINFENKTAKTYSRIYGIRFGKWVSISSYPFISILSKQYGSTIESKSNLQVHMGRSTYLEVHLLNKTHTRKFFINSHKIRSTANSSINYLASKLEIEVVKYNPVISQKTKDRRYGKRK